ncbi:hypothetical protein C9374_009759 [Naegleria lovaniensis]|uniref:CNH domain-containing protein n=1 Tax=Naegleria lovaniensis TaxID=51637 RepID=A0AA88H5D3_NAELO|nr:uncharacterized protein C9374_009759 [Naegleria lovaniensis]KAG2393182.1 hypothetical protein C9374_009759 [Naegleria lovaniensis]
MKRLILSSHGLNKTLSSSLCPTFAFSSAILKVRNGNLRDLYCAERTSCNNNVGLININSNNLQGRSYHCNTKCKAAATKKNEPSEDEEEFEAKFLLHFGGLTIPFAEKPKNIEELKELVATGLSIQHNKDCIKFFEIDEKNFEKQLAGWTKVKKEVTDLDKFDGVSIQAVLKIMVHPYSFLQLKDPFYIYLHDIKTSDDISRALHTYTWRYKYCYVDKISVPSESSASTDVGTPANSTTATTPSPSTQKEIKKHTILKLIDGGKPIGEMEKAILIEDFGSYETKVASMVSADKYLWIGGHDGRLYMFTINEQMDTTGIKYSVALFKKKLVTTKKAITSLQVDPPHKKLFALVDNTVCVYDMTTLLHLETLEATKGTQSYAINKNYSHELVAVVKRKLIVYDYREQMELVREIKVPGNDNVIGIEWMKKTICLGFKNRHIMMNYQTGEIDEDLQKLQLTNIISDEYSMYGCFVKIIGTTSGIQWKETPTVVSICFPFLLGISKGSIEVYNMYEKKFDETIVNDKATISSDHMQKVFISNKKTVSLLTPKPIDQHITDLIDKMRLLEAFGLFEKTFQGTKKEKERKLFMYEQQAGFACFFRTRFKEAFAHFNKSRIDPREILFYFKDLIEPQTNFVPQKARGDLRDKIKNAMEQEGEETTPLKIDVRIKNAKKALQEFLEKCRKMRVDEFGLDQLAAIDYALANLYLNEFKKYGQLKTLLRSENHLRLENGEILFKHNARYLAFLYYSKNEYRKALQILKELGEGTRMETTTVTNGVEESIELLSENEDEDLVMEYAAWVFEADESSAIQIFTSRMRKKKINPHRVLSFLAQYPKDLERSYLEYVIVIERNCEEKFHTALILNYIDAIIVLKPAKYLPFGVRLEAGKETGLLGQIRARLIHLLKHTNFFNKYRVLSKLQKTNLYEETLILYRKVQNHNAALKLLVHKIQDLEWAERYCVDCYLQMLEEMHLKEEAELKEVIRQRHLQAAGIAADNIHNDKDDKKNMLKKDISLQIYNPLLLTLLNICWYPDSGFPKNESFAIHILTTHAKSIDPMKALEILPTDLLVSKVADFLRQAMQSSLDVARNVQVIYNMSKIRHVQTKVELAKGNARRVLIGEEQGNKCASCGKSIDACSVFVVLPDLSYVHFKCVNKHSINIHPVTGRNFKNFPVNFDDISEAAILNPPYQY